MAAILALAVLLRAFTREVDAVGASGLSACADVCPARGAALLLASAASAVSAAFVSASSSPDDIQRTGCIGSPSTPVNSTSFESFSVSDSAAFAASACAASAVVTFADVASPEGPASAVPSDVVNAFAGAGTAGVSGLGGTVCAAICGCTVAVPAAAQSLGSDCTLRKICSATVVGVTIVSDVDTTPSGASLVSIGCSTAVDSVSIGSEPSLAVT